MYNVIEIPSDNDTYFTSNLKLRKPDGTPNGVIIHNLKEAYNKKRTVKLGNISELSFDIPYYINRNHRIIRNPLIDMIRLNYIVTVNYKGRDESFIITNDSKKLSSDGETLSFTLKNRAYSLARFDVYNFTTDTLNLSTTASQLINESESRWTLGFVDSSFNSIFRSVNIEVSTVLESIFTIAQTFGAIPEFDTENSRVNFRTLESTGNDKGFQAKEGIVLEDYDIQTNLDEIVTRLKCYGREGLEFRSLSPTGSNYIQDFSYFIAPFERDSNRNVIRHSNYMTDELCHALLDYEILVESVNSQFNNLLQDRAVNVSELSQRQQEVSNLTTTRRTVELQIDLINLTYGDQASTRDDWEVAVDQLNQLTVNINEVNQIIASFNRNISSIDSQISQLRLMLDTNSNFTQRQLDELAHNYVFVKEYTDENIISEEQLLQAGREQFNKYREPLFTINFTIASFVNDFRVRANRRKIILGDIVTFNSRKFNTRVKSKIVELQEDLDTNEVNIIVSNDLEKLTDEEILINLLNHNNTLNKNIEKNLYKLNLGQQANTEVNRLLRDGFDTARTILTGGYENTNEMTDRGFYSRSVSNPQQDFLVINGGGLYITRDGARTVEVAINSEGVLAERIVGRFILSERLDIGSESGIITLSNNSILIKDNNDNDRIVLGRYTSPDNINQQKYGLFVTDGSFELRTSSQVNRGVQLDANGIRAYNSNGARVFEIDSFYGDLFFSGVISSSTINGGVIQTTTDPNRGIKLNELGLEAFNNLGERTVFLDITGVINIENGNFSGNITASNINGGTFTGGTYSGGTFTGNNINGATITGTDINGSNITGSNITGTNISGATITGATINGGTISVETDVRVGRILRVGTFVNDTTDNAALVFGGDEVVSTAAYIQATYIFNNTGLRINARAGIDIMSEASINLRASRVESYGATYINGGQNNTATLGIASGSTSQGSVLEYYRNGSFTSRLGFIGYNTTDTFMTIQNNTGARISMITTGTVFRINTDGVSVRNRNETAYQPIAASAFTQNSRREDKKNILPFSCDLNMTALEKINSTNVYKYHYNNELDTDLKHTGLILDEVPLEMVDPKGVGVDLYGMASLLWKAVQELTQELNDLKNNN